MKKLKIAAVLLITVTIFSVACTERSTNTVETTEITQMDSTSKRAKAAAERMEEQTKKVEASIEKLDEEFKTNN